VTGKAERTGTRTWLLSAALLGGVEETFLEVVCTAKLSECSGARYSRATFGTSPV
jgi:hypothetical protein